MHSYILISYLLDYLTFTGCFFLNIISIIIITLFYYFILLNYVSVDSSFTDSIYYFILLLCNLFLQVVFPNNIFTTYVFMHLFS